MAEVALLSRDVPGRRGCRVRQGTDTGHAHLVSLGASGRRLVLTPKICSHAEGAQATIDPNGQEQWTKLD